MAISIPFARQSKMLSDFASRNEIALTGEARISDSQTLLQIFDYIYIATRTIEASGLTPSLRGRTYCAPLVGQLEKSINALLNC